GAGANLGAVLQTGTPATVFYRWQKEFLENGAAAFQPKAVEGYDEHYNNVRPEQCDRLHHAEGHARRASAGDPRRQGSEAGGGEATTTYSSPVGRVKQQRR